MRMLRPPGTLIIALLTGACTMSAAQTDQAALLTNPGPEVQQELSAAIARLTGFASVALSMQDFTRDSELFIERKPQTDNNGELIQGRNLEKPHRIGLVFRDGKCWLVDQNSGQRSPLMAARCRVK